jgi:hypothetical protein
MALYTVIARHLMANPAPPGCNSGGCSASTPGGGGGGGTISGGPGVNTGGRSHHPPQQSESSNLRARRQVVLMLGTVVLSFFICLMPFRVFTLWIIVVPHEKIISLGVEGYYNLLFFCRIMVYLNSALNPILYNLMSSKFRVGFTRLCGLRKRRRGRWRRSGPGGCSEIRRLGSAGDLTLVRGEIASRSGGVGVFTRNGTLTSLSYSSFHHNHAQARHSPELRVTVAADVTRLSSLESSPPTTTKEERTNNNSPIHNNGSIRKSLIVRATVPSSATSSLDKPMLTRYTMRPSFDSQPESYV